MQPRLCDDRVGYFSVTVTDYTDEGQQVKEKCYITRYRLEKKDPTAEISDPVKPIVYYIDPATPKKWIPWFKKAIEDWRKSPDFEKTLQEETDRREEVRMQRRARERERERQEIEQRVRAEYEQKEQAARVNWLQNLRNEDSDAWMQAMEDPVNASAWAGAKTPPKVDEQALIRQGVLQAYDGIKAELRRKPVFKGLSEDAWDAICHKADTEANSQAEWFGVFFEAAGSHKSDVQEAKDTAEDRAAIEAQVRAKLRKGEGPEDVTGAGGSGQLTRKRYNAMSSEERAKVSPEEIDAMTQREFLRKT